MKQAFPFGWGWILLILCGSGNLVPTTSKCGSVGRCCLFAAAKEIEATHEWTALGENDTVAAGMHIRIDMTTGEKWVKLMDDDEEKNSSDNNEQKGVVVQQMQLSQSSKQVQVDVSGSSASATTTTTTTSTASTDKEPEPNYDFEMMYRTLSKLPDEEKQRIQLPPYYLSAQEQEESNPRSSPTDAAATERRILFEQRLKQIWEARQEELRHLELADLPQLLKDRIQSLKDYLDDPLGHLIQIQNDNDESAATTTSTSADANVNENNRITDIAQVLKDLEYHMQDIDITRDFHTLGGFPLLALLLSDQVHEVGPTIIGANDFLKRNGDNETSDQFFWTDRIHRVQMHAAWALGTAVKNTAEFTPYVLEKITLVPNHGSATTTTTTTVLDLVLQQLSKAFPPPIPSRSSSSSTNRTAVAVLSSSTDTAQAKSLKLIYCLGACLRGNRAAQIHFAAANGPTILSQALQTFILVSEEENAVKEEDQKSFASKMAIRLLNLASDAVFDITLHRTNEGANDDQRSRNVEDALVSAWTSPEWCAAVVSTLQQSRSDIQLAALHTMRAVASHCQWQVYQRQQQPAVVIDAIQRLRRVWEAATTTTSLTTDIHPDVLQEWIAMADEIVDQLTTDK